MLTTLHIKNFILIDEVNVHLENGFTALTGETGAGKSMILAAIQAVLGQNLSVTMLKNQKERLEVQASFDLNSTHVSTIEFLKQFELDDDSQCNLRRTLNADGTSKTYINGIPVRVNLLKELATTLVRLHSQHAKQDLLKAAYQREFLDQYGNHAVYLEKISTLHQKWQQLKQDYENYLQSQQLEAAHQNLLTYQITELAELNLAGDEVDKLEQAYKKCTHAEKILQISAQAQAQAHLQQNELSKLQRTLAELSQFDQQLMSSVQMAEQAQILLTEIDNEVDNFLSSIDVDVQQKQYLETRLENIYALARKHHIAPHELPAHLIKLQQEAENYQNNESLLQQTAALIQTVEDDYLAIAKELSVSRQKAAHKLSVEVSRWLPKLGMQGGIFSIELKANPEATPSRFGLEQVEFFITTNPGRPAQLLNKIVSGGELSRLSLILEVIQTQKKYTPILIFDEVDTGIGGHTALIIGELLKQLSHQQQVLCITHLPQVAAFADNQIHISKFIHEQTTSLQITPLEEPMRLHELARMLGGKTIKEASMLNARELLATARKTQKEKVNEES